LAGFTGTVSFTTPGGTVTAQYAGSGNFAHDVTKLGQTGVTKGDFTIASSTDSAVTTAGGGSFEDYAGAVGLAYTSFGVWSLNPCDNSSSCLPKYAGAFAGGQPGQTPTSSMPTTGSATYTGGAVGYVVQPNAAHTAGEFYGASSLTVNFVTGGITGSITGITAYSTNNSGSGATQLGTVNNIGLTATISGSNFSGTTNVTGGAGTAFNIAGATGSLAGSFYGPTAQEVAGVFSLSGGTNSVAVVGSLGAKQATPSDRRLKQDIVAAGTLPNGLKLYSWRYLGGAHRFVGVMAQDLLEDRRFSDAVEVDADGLMRVDYARIGYLPADIEAMRSEGEAAVATYRGTLH
jgi:hypothetical protein